MSYKNNQPVYVGNKYDKTTGRYVSAKDNPLSDNYGDDRDVIGGRGLEGDGSFYIEIIGLLSTDTYTVDEGSDNITISNGRVDIALNDVVYGIKVYRASTLIGVYHCEEGGGNVLVNADTSTSLPNGNFFNSSSSNFVERITGGSQADQVGYTSSDGATYYYEQSLTTLIPLGVAIPRDESNPTKCCAFIIGGVQADMQYKGRNPYYLEVKESGCFEGDSLAYLTTSMQITSPLVEFDFWTTENGLSAGEFKVFFDSRSAGTNGVLLNLSNETGTNPFLVIRLRGGVNEFASLISWTALDNDNYKHVSVRVFGGIARTVVQEYSTDELKLINTYSNNVAVTDTDTITPADMYIGSRAGFSTSAFQLAGKLFDVKIYELDNLGNRLNTYVNLPLQNLEADGTTYYDVSGNGNHATLINGSSANYGLQNEFHYLQDNGFRLSGSVRIPALEDGTAAADGNALTHIQDGNRLLDSGNTYSFPAAPEIVQTDVNNDLFEIDGTPKKLTFAEWVLLNLTDNQYFIDNSDTKYISQIRYHSKNAFVDQRQVNTDKKITNN